MIKKIITFVRGYLGVLAIGIAFIVSAFIVFLNNTEPSEDTYIVKPGDTITSIAAAYSMTVDKIVGANYPDIDGAAPVTAGMRIKGFLSDKTLKQGEQWAKYRYAVARPIVRRMNVSYERALMEAVEHGKGDMPDAYEYSKEARARIGIR
ncbi:MAG: LysM domain-containing protein [Spirochaetota bacterium]